jgi:L-seryl-tRNA(Ser) seleniumtransferase
VTVAALDAVLRLYADPDRLIAQLPTLRLLARRESEIRTLAERVAPKIATRLGSQASISVEACRSQIGSGSLPVQRLPSAALVIRTAGRKDRDLQAIAAAFRRLPVPVVGRIGEAALHFDCRCLEDEDAFIAQLDALSLNADLSA